MKLLIISGSARKNANTRKLIESATIYLEQQHSSVHTLTFDVGSEILPIMNSEEESYAHPNVKKLTEIANQADGFFICTPEYHNGMSGALKNALDFLSARQFAQKPVSIGSVSGGGKGGINALNNLRLVMRGVGAIALPQQVIADPADFLVSGKLTESAQLRLSSVLDELVSFLSKLHN
jgi:azobenzene reductase